MTQATLSDDVARRIALVARLLPHLGMARLIQVIEDAIGLPPTARGLEGLEIPDLKAALGDELADLDEQTLQEALAILRGEPGTLADPDLPPVEPYAEGDMPDSIRVACASDTGDLLDGHFGQARRFLIYQVSAQEDRLIAMRVPEDAHGDNTQAGDKTADRVRLIQDCQLLYIASIGGPAAAQVVKANVHPIKDTQGGPAHDRIIALRQVLASKVPPWLAKLMGRPLEERIRFESQGHEP
ncbi:NifB/NifX family molybdenum-iron cluster-binding protein [Candidatus Thiosymbion oneisti]|uniref:NifB/NifX family molybdenum-iron cluster-binding protein n=1 Tax=Candidatus Thiosymbion oneisti TaxID=589554 RepID=UPI0010605A4D|nr:NifB/NifX family molybdenum-iron cluster-binding protein [Candidatus Thiosymbion oneisti]